MLKRWIVVGTLMLVCLAAQAEDLPVFVNGVKVALPSVEVGNQHFYPVPDLAQAMGYRLENTGSGFTLNGQPLKGVPMMLDGKPYVTLESAAQTVGAVVVRDPVRRMISITCNAAAANQGFEYYNASYKTPEQQKREEHDRMLANSGNPGMSTVDNKWGEWGKLYPKTNRALDRTNRGPHDVKMPAHPWLVPEDDTMMTSPDQSPQTNLPLAAAQPGMPGPEGFATKVADNGVYRVTISNVRVTEVLKGISESMVPRAGCNFVVVYLTEENVSKLEQKTAWFALRDQAGVRHEANPALSKFSLAPLRAHETTTGYIIVEFPMGAQPSALELICDPPLSVSLL